MSEEQYKAIFSENLKKWMADRIVTQQQLADAIGVGQSTVSAWCNGEKMPRMGKIEMLAYRHMTSGVSDATTLQVTMTQGKMQSSL